MKDNLKGVSVAFTAAPKVALRTEQDVRDYMDVLLGNRERAIATGAQHMAAGIIDLIQALEKDAHRLSPETRDAIADTARRLDRISTGLHQLTRPVDRPVRTLS